MKQRMLLYGFTLLLGVFALSSCVNEDSVCLPEGSDVKVAFSLVLPDNAQTRAEGDWSDAYNSEIGTDYDNYIDLDGIQVLVFNPDEEGLYQGTVTNFMYSKTGENVYTYFGDAPAELTPRGTYKFVVLANCSKVTGLTIGTSTISALDNITYSLADMEYIPMWGVHKATLNLKPGQQYNIGDIDLLRAMSKVTVQLSQDMITRGFTLENLKVDNYNTQGYATPTNASSVAETTELDQEACVRPKTSAATNLSGTVNNNSVELYLPEYKNIGSTKPATMSVTLQLTEEVEVVDESGTHTETVVDHLPFPAGIEFKNYSDDSDFDIVRNHHYIFTITDAQVGHRLQFEVIAQPWDDEVVKLDYKESISWKNGGKPKWTYPPTTTTGTETIDNIDYTVLNVKGGDEISCSFTLDAPVGWLWYAELDPLTEGAQNFITFTNGSTSANGTVGQAATLYLKINSQTTSVVHKSRLRLYVRTPSNDRSIEVGSEDVRYIISREF